MGALEQYGALMASALISIGSIGMLPYVVEGVIIFSIVLLISLTFLIKSSEKFYLSGFIYSILAGISLIFAFNYIAGSILSIILGIFYFISVPVMMYIAISRFRNESVT